MDYISRHIQTQLLEALSTSPVVLIHGARQTGKSTLAQRIAEEKGMDYLTLDDFTILGAVQQDAVGFLQRFDRPLIIDEIQKAPQLFSAIKLLVDRKRTPGRYLLTGSADVLLLPKLSESLAGRMEIITLRPFSCDELHNFKSGWIDQAFDGAIAIGREYPLSRLPLIESIINGGYPEVQNLDSASRRQAWFHSYIETILQRDIRDIAQINGLYDLHRLLSIAAARSGSVLNMSSLARDTGLVLMTLKRYLAILETAFMIQRIPAWFRNIGKRLVKAPKLYLNDTGLLAHLTGCSSERLQNDPQLLGPLFESFVIQELMKQASWSLTKPAFHYYRSFDGQEIDLVLENRTGEIVGIEIKASSTVGADHFKVMRELKHVMDHKFVHGIILYLGDKVVPFGDRLTALPVCTLWNEGTSQPSQE